MYEHKNSSKQYSTALQIQGGGIQNPAMCKYLDNEAGLAVVISKKVRFIPIIEGLGVLKNTIG